MRRLPHFAYVGPYRYSLTWCTFERRPVFTDGAAVETVRSQVLQCATAQGFGVLVYCFMPDHVHLPVEGRSEESSLHRFVHVAKTRSGYVHAQRSGHRLWQPGYHDRVVRRSDEIADLIAYILENPVRAGLVRSVEEYPFSGSAVYTTEQLLECVGTRRAGARGA